MNTHKHARTALTAIALVALCVATPAMAQQNLGQVATNVSGSFQGIYTLVTWFAYLAGAIFAVVGLMQFKAYRDNAQQTPLSKPVLCLALAAALVAVPSVIDTGTATIWEGSENRINPNW